MRKGLWLVVLGVAIAAAAWATQHEIDDAWAGCMTDTAPNTLTPTQLISGYGDSPVVMVPSAGRAKMENDDDFATGDYYNYYEPDEYEHCWLMARFANWGSYTWITARYAARISGGETVKLYAWSGSEWVHLNTNSGGQDPDYEKELVTYFMGDEYLYLLIQSRSWPTGRDFDVDWCDLNSSP